MTKTPEEPVERISTTAVDRNGSRDAERCRARASLAIEHAASEPNGAPSERDPRR